MPSLPKYVYTGYSDKRDGLLVLTDMDWDEFCQSQGGTHREIDDNHILVMDGYEVDDEELEYAIENAEHRWGSMALYRSETKINENLSEAVCW